jgi:predicted transposase YbfD/YdcC
VPDTELAALPEPRTLYDCFRDVRDPRVVGRSEHALYDIIAIILIATIAGCNDFVAMADFAQNRQQWLRERMGLKLLNGVPSHDTLLRVMSILNPDEFHNGFLQFVKLTIRAIPELANKDIAIDGKALCGSTHEDLDGVQRMVHMVGAWSTEAGLALGQIPTDEKSNEITAIPKLLELLDISGALVTIDAMGCQKEIAATIVAGNGDYLLQVKGNQPHLHEDLQVLTATLENENFTGFDRHVDDPGKKQHGRLEYRETVVIDDLELLKDSIRDFELWKDLKSVVITKSIREVNGVVSRETRYHISSRVTTAAIFGKSVRGHWGIENGLHWVLDVAFGEDDHRLYGGHAAANLATVRRMVLPLLKKPDVQLGMKNRRLKASYDQEFLEEVIAGIPEEFDA